MIRLCNFQHWAVHLTLLKASRKKNHREKNASFRVHWDNLGIVIPTFCSQRLQQCVNSNLQTLQCYVQWYYSLYPHVFWKPGHTIQIYLMSYIFMPSVYIHTHPRQCKLNTLVIKIKGLNCKGKAPRTFMQHADKIVNMTEFIVGMETKESWEFVTSEHSCADWQLSLLAEQVTNLVTFVTGSHTPTQFIIKPWWDQVNSMSRWISKKSNTHKW